MHVVATAGHVDHGKSALVQALTGADPDRLDEEHRRGLSIELGYCWTALPGAGDVAFVDVPGHERFVSTMLAGVGPVPAVLFVVAADDPWMPQAAEHLRALNALGVEHGVVAVTRSDLADPEPALRRARAQVEDTSLRHAPAIAVSARTGQGMDGLRRLLVEMVTRMPVPDPGEDVRIWVDRSFHVHGTGTVVTGTLPAGRVCNGDALALSSGRSPDDRTVRVRGLQTLERPVDAVTGPARVALNLGGTTHDIARGSALVTPGAWEVTAEVDVRVRSGPLPERPVLHVGAASVAVRVRPLGPGSARLRLASALPLRVGDRALLRDPGSRQIWGVTVLDPVPAPLRRRGAARILAGELAEHPGVPDLVTEVRRRGMVRLELLRRLGVDVKDALVEDGGLLSGGWVVSAEKADDLRGRLARLVADHENAHPLDPGLPVDATAAALDLPSRDLVPDLVHEPMRLAHGQIRTGAGPAALPAAVEAGLAELEHDLSLQPFAAPTSDRLHELGLDPPAAAAAARAGRLLRIGEGVVLLPSAEEAAAAWLRELPQPFTTSQARIRLHTSRRVVLPLLAHLDRQGRTRRLPDDRRTVV